MRTDQWSVEHRLQHCLNFLYQRAHELIFFWDAKLFHSGSNSSTPWHLKKGELHAKVRKWRAELGKCRAGSGNVWICQQNRHGILHHQRTFIYNHWESRSKHISCALSHVIPQKRISSCARWYYLTRKDKARSGRPSHSGALMSQSALMPESAGFYAKR